MPIREIAVQVMQREPSLGLLWVVFLALGLAGLLAARYRPSYLWMLVPAILVEGLAQRAELFDRAVKPLILREAGRGYFTQSYTAFGTALLLIIIGVVWRRVTTTQRADPPPDRTVASEGPASG